MKRPGLKAHARGQIVVQSQESRLRSQRMTAFFGAKNARSDIPVHAGLVPLGYRRGAFSALVQVAVGSAPVAGATWEIGASFVSSGEITSDISTRIRVTEPGAAFAMEREMELRPGSYAIVAVAQETSTELTATGIREVSWPDPEEAPATVLPITILQPEAAVFDRDKAVRKSGNLIREEGAPVRADLPTAMVGLVCRSKKQDRPLRVERRLTGETTVEFATLDFATGDGICVQVRDIVPAKTLGEGRFRYEIVVRDGEETLASRAREFDAARPHP